MQPAMSSTFIPTGDIRSFGSFCPAYEVGQPVRELENGDWMVEITLVETGEKAEYRLSDLLDDPEAK
jgi:hypothetical protein